MQGKRRQTVSGAVREWTQFAALIFASGWGVYTFVFKETILPARRPATLTVTTKLEELGRKDEHVLMRLWVHAVNRTDRKIYVPALWYAVRGLSLSSQPGTLADYRSQIEFAPQSEIHARYSALTEADVVAVGTILSRTTDYYEPTDETTNEILFEVPIDRYDALEAKAQFFVTKQTDALTNAGWTVQETGELAPKLTQAGRPYDPEFDPQHHAWALAAGAGFNWSSSTVSLLPAEPHAPAPLSVPDPRWSSRP